MLVAQFIFTGLAFIQVLSKRIFRQTNLIKLYERNKDKMEKWGTA